MHDVDIVPCQQPGHYNDFGCHMNDVFENGGIEAYFGLMHEQPELFAHRPGDGIEVLTERHDIKAAQESARHARRMHNMDVSDLRVGVLASDPYMLVLRDAVRFADGSLGLYNRVVEVKCAAMLPLLDGRPVLVKIFRHALRNWTLEFPRGACDPGEAPEGTVRRELREEIGANVRELIPLGDFTPGGASLAIRGNLYAAHIDGTGKPQRADNIAEIKVVDIAEVKELIRTSQIYDGFSMALFLRARLAGII
jgi:ADP-ribose pyrophosphatase